MRNLTKLRPNNFEQKHRKMLTVGILMDKHGFEISRNIIPNPYYKSIEQIQKEEDYYNSIKDDPERLADYFAQINKAVNEQN